MNQRVSKMSTNHTLKIHVGYFPVSSRGIRPHVRVAGPGTNANVDSARANLAGTFVNAFANAGFGNDKLMVEAEEGSSWIYKNKDHGTLRVSSGFQLDLEFISGMISAAASLGLSLLWDTELGLSQVDKYTYSSEEYIKVRSVYRFTSE